jgi:hypothetical protein
MRVMVIMSLNDGAVLRVFGMIPKTVHHVFSEGPNEPPCKK